MMEDDGGLRYAAHLVGGHGAKSAFAHPTELALALPDQDQAQGGERRAISRPLDLLDHEARLRPVDHARALADPQKPHGECEKA